MSPRPATTEPLAIGIIAGEVATAAAGASPEWIRVTPRGEVRTRDARSYAFNPEALVARFNADGVDIPADIDHGLALRAVRGERVDAVGYAAELQARDDGTWARMTWLDGGLSVLAARTHRYISPTFPHDAAGNAVWLHSISLVAAPALSMPALLHALGYPETPMKQIAKALGLPETADEAACLAALGGRTEVKPLAVALGLAETATVAACLSAAGKAAGALKPLAKKLNLPETADEAACLAAIGGLQAGGSELVGQLQSQLATTSARLETVVKAGRERDVNELLDGALKDKKIVPAQRPEYAKLCATDEGLAGVKALLAATAPGLQASGLDGRTAEAGAGEGDPATLAAKARKLFDDRRSAGQPIDWSTAVTLAAEAKA